MHRRSESIASLAAALAKAQMELQNPQKSLVGAIEGKDRDAPERLFRYASLATGLEIVRKTLGQHGIATVQTTEIHHATGTVNLSTVLAHASGEWIASEWPVCPVSDTATPHRMGAALTYARRYALFTLVGIAGEDDLDAPDLIGPIQRVLNKAGHADRFRSPVINGRGRSNPAQQSVQRRPAADSSKKKFSAPEPALLALELSAKLRDEMLAELNDVGTSEEAARWAKRRYPDKSKKLTSDDAAVIDQSFSGKVLSLAIQNEQSLAENGSGRCLVPQQKAREKRTSLPLSDPIEKDVLAFPEPRRIRDRDHVRYVAQQSCLICGRKPCDAHHVRFAQARAIGRKVSDEFTVPLCRGHHRELHHFGDESSWWRKIAIDPISAARTLWLETHGSSRVERSVSQPSGQESSNSE